MLLILSSAPPCNPSPCGPGAVCTTSGSSAICSCPSGTYGDAKSTGCRPECVVSSECPRDRACVRNKCIDPCIGTCGNGAMCRVFDHAPICSCPPTTTGNPFTECTLKGTEIMSIRLDLHLSFCSLQSTFQVTSKNLSVH